MNHALRRSPIAGMIALLAAWPAWCQKGGGSRPPGGSPPPSQPVGPAMTAPAPPSIQTPSPQMIYGRVIMGNGQPVPESVPVGLYCGLRTVQMVQSDLKGQFEFTLGSHGTNTVFSADNDAAMSPDGRSKNPSDGFVQYGSSEFKLMGCELRVSVGGYLPLTKVIADPGSLGATDVGTLVLERLAGVQGSAISVTSLMIPGNARKEFEKGETAARNRQFKSAAEHFERAVALYDNYAAAWNDLGKVQSVSNQPEDARHAFEKAIAADPHYLPPYVNLAELELRQGRYESAAEAAKKALEQDPNEEFAMFLEAAADFNLKRFDDAEKCARAAEERPHQDIPQIHVLLADVYLQRRDYPSAAAQMRAYLKEAPHGELAPEMRKSLGQIEGTAAQTGNNSTPSAP